jgi:hypothetical protein
MIDREIDDRPVILKSPNQPHAFTRSNFHLFCDTCLGRRGNIIHDAQYVEQAKVERHRNIARNNR